MRGEAMADQPVTAVVWRRIKAGSEASFESLMREFMTSVLRQSGHLGINVLSEEELRSIFLVSPQSSLSRVIGRLVMRLPVA